MSDSIDKEIEAIKKVLQALEPLDAKTRKNVLDYVLKRLDVTLTSPMATASHLATEIPAERSAISAHTQTPQAGVMHIKTLKEQKQPSSAIEMAAIVAYYLANVADKEHRKESVNTTDLETWFKIAEFKLPSRIDFTLPNTKKAGYMERIGEGEYKLNAVGYNLVVHSLPKSGGVSASRPKKKKAAKKSKKKSAKKKS